MISGCGRSAGAVIPALGSGRYSPGPNIVGPSWLKGSDPNCTINVFGGQPGALATVSNSFRLRRIKGCIKSSFGMGIQIVHHEANLLYVRIMLINQFFDKVRPIHLRALL